MKLRVVPAVCGLSALLLLSAVYAQDAKKEAPKGPQMDEVSKRLIENWDKSMYHLGRLGVKKASCKAKMSVSQMGQERVGNLTYKWDGKKGKMEWDDAQMGAMMSGGGGLQQSFDEDFKLEHFRDKLGTAKYTAKATETGHVVTVDGKTKAGFKSFTFDKDGVLAQLAMETTGQRGPQKIKMKLTFTKVDGKYLLESQDGAIEGGMGQMGLAIKFTYTRVGNFQVKAKQVTSISMGGNLMGSHTLEYSDWKLNDDVDAPPAPKPAEPKK